MKKFRETGFRVSGRTRLQIRQVAHHLRDFSAREYGLDGSAFDVTGLIEKWGLLRARGSVDHPDYLIVEDDELPGRAGEFRPSDGHTDDDDHENVFLFPRSVWDSACDGYPEARETVAHEIGHCVLRHPKLTYARAYYDETVIWRTDSEWQANVFKDELLMDSRLVPTAERLESVVRHFNVTQETAIRHTKELMNERK